MGDKEPPYKEGETEEFPWYNTLSNFMSNAHIADTLIKNLFYDVYILDF